MKIRVKDEVLDLLLIPGPIVALLLWLVLSITVRGGDCLSWRKDHYHRDAGVKPVVKTEMDSFGLYGSAGSLRTYTTMEFDSGADYDYYTCTQESPRYYVYNWIVDVLKF